MAIVENGKMVNCPYPFSDEIRKNEPLGSAGKPIITSNIESMKEISDGVGLSVEYGNVEQLVKEIERLKQDKKLYSECSKKAVEKAKKYSWENIVNQIEQLYLDIISKRCIGTTSYFC